MKIKQVPLSQKVCVDMPVCPRFSDESMKSSCVQQYAVSGLCDAFSDPEIPNNDNCNIKTTSAPLNSLSAACRPAR